MSLEMVRPAVTSDIEGISAVLTDTILSDHARHLPEPPNRASVKAASDKLALQWPKMAVVESQGRIVGVVMTVDNKVEALNVVSSHQGQGIGSALLAWAEDTIRSNGHLQAELDTYATNSAAIGLYEQNGYAVVRSWSQTAFTRLPVKMVTMAKAFLIDASTTPAP